MTQTDLLRQYIREIVREEILAAFVPDPKFKKPFRMITTPGPVAPRRGRRRILTDDQRKEKAASYQRSYRLKKKLEGQGKA